MFPVCVHPPPLRWMVIGSPGPTTAGVIVSMLGRIVYVVAACSPEPVRAKIRCGPPRASGAIALRRPESSQLRLPPVSADVIPDDGLPFDRHFGRRRKPAAREDQRTADDTGREIACQCRGRPLVAQGIARPSRRLRRRARRQVRRARDDAKTLRHDRRDQRLIIRALLLIQIRRRSAFDRREGVHPDRPGRGDRRACRSVGRNRGEPTGLRAVVHQVPNRFVKAITDTGQGDADRRPERSRVRRDRQFWNDREALMRQHGPAGSQVDVVKVAEILGYSEAERETPLGIGRPVCERPHRFRCDDPEKITVLGPPLRPTGMPDERNPRPRWEMSRTGYDRCPDRRSRRGECQECAEYGDEHYCAPGFLAASWRTAAPTSWPSGTKVTW